MTPQVTLIARRGITPVGELWSASSEEGATLTVEVPDPATPDVDTSRWEFLPRALHPALALPLPVGTISGLAVALSPNIGRPALTATGLAGPLATLGAGIAGGLAALHAAGLGHDAITPSLICTTPDGHVQLAVTAACALPLDVAGDLQGLRDALAALDPDAYTQISRDHDLGRAAGAHDLADLLTSAALGTVAATLPADVSPGPPPPPPSTPPPGSRLAPMPPPGGGIPSGGNPSGGIRPAASRERRALPTHPLVIAGGIGVALVALAAIAGAATGGTAHTPAPKPTTGPSATYAATGSPTVVPTTPAAAATALAPAAIAAPASPAPAAAATALAPAAIAAPASPAPASSSPAASPHPQHTAVHATHGPTAKPSRTPAAARTYATTASVAPRPSPVMTRPAPVTTKPAPKPKATTAQPVVTGTVAPPH